MSHSLYELTSEPSHTVYGLLQDEIGLTAKSGLIASFVRQSRGTEPGGWLMNERDLLSRSGGDSDTRAIVVDLKPNSAKGLVNLFRMRGIVGYSYVDWTPVCFLLEELIDNELSNDPQGFKRTFTRPSNYEGRSAVSPVYLRAGAQHTQQKGGVWYWGNAGVVNGPILFPDAWCYFDQELRTSGWFN